MNKSITFKRGLDLKLQGGIASDATIKVITPRMVAVTPDDFPGFTPKVEVKVGDKVVAGQSLMHDKNCEEIKLVTPISGIVESVTRGERRKVIHITVKPDNSTDAIQPIKPTDAQSIKTALMNSGLWAMMRQRPYDIIPLANSNPENIFVTAFDSTPLAPCLTDSVKGKEREIEAGVKALAQLTSGKVFICTRKDESIAIPTEATHIIVNGPHPAGNAGVQAAALAPVNKGQTIWTLDIVTLARIGYLMLNGNVNWDTTIALTGSEIETPHIINSVFGADIASIISDSLKNSGKNQRIISGNVLTGQKESIDGYMHFPYRQITVIPEGDDVDEFMGWASLSPKKMSENRSFPSKLFGRRNFAPDARIQGGKRAMIMSGIYEKMMPMDILPEHLIKAIISRDIDKMEALGIYEIAPEDFALCEYADPSKLELQKIVREGLNYLRKELE